MLFDYKSFEKIVKNSNINTINKNNEKEIYEFIENLSETYINSIKERISHLTTNIFEKEKFDLTEIKTKENISFNYIKYFDNMILDGTIINFSLINSIPKESFIRIKIFFIKDKILILFKNNEQNQIYGQIGILNNSENYYSFDIEYLFSFKKSIKEFNNNLFVLDRVLKEKEDIDNFYQKIYRENTKKIFECKISEDLILYVLNFNKNGNSIINKNKNEINSFFVNEISDIRDLNDNKKEYFSEIKARIQIPLKLKNYSKISFTQAYIVNKEIINKLKRNYNLNGVISYLNNNQQLNEINYQNFNENYSKISEFLNKNQTNYINKIKQIERQSTNKFNEQEGSLVLKKLNNNGLKYIDNIEIIDKDFVNYLYQIFNNNIAIYKIDFIKIESKIFLIIYYNRNYIYEISSLNENDIMTIEYLIEIKKNNMTNDINTLNNYIVNVLLENGIQNLISYGNPINIENRLIFNLLAIKENL